MTTVNCECGSIVLKGSLSRHRKSKKHQKIMGGKLKDTKIEDLIVHFLEKLVPLSSQFTETELLSVWNNEKEEKKECPEEGSSDEVEECVAWDLGCDCSCEKCIKFGNCDEGGTGWRKCEEFYKGENNADWCAECLFLKEQKRKKYREAVKETEAIVFRDENEVLQDIATSTIQNNWYRKENSFRDFTKAELKQINKRMGIKNKGEKIISGFSFLDNKDSTDGCICLYDKDHYKLRWGFRYEYYKSKGYWDSICKSCGLKADTHTTDERVECGTLIKSIEVWEC